MRTSMEHATVRARYSGLWLLAEGGLAVATVAYRPGTDLRAAAHRAADSIPAGGVGYVEAATTRLRPAAFAA